MNIYGDMDQTENLLDDKRRRINMNYEDIKERVGWGEEFLFRYNNDEYWISQNESKRYLTRVRGSFTQEFQTTEELFEKGRVEGKTLLEIWDEIKDFF